MDHVVTAMTYIFQVGMVQRDVWIVYVLGRDVDLVMHDQSRFLPAPLAHAAVDCFARFDK